jgi:hypothetical protein
VQALNTRSIERHISHYNSNFQGFMKSICHRPGCELRLLTMGWKSKAREKGAIEKSKGIPPPSRSTSSPKPLQCCTTFLLPLVDRQQVWLFIWFSTEHAQPLTAIPEPPNVVVKVRSTWQYKHAVYHDLEVHPASANLPPFLPTPQKSSPKRRQCDE